MNEGRIVEQGAPREVVQTKTAKTLGTGLPKATQVVLQLVEKGIPMNFIPLNGREATPLLRKLLRGEKK
ncbi:MAG: hypothetical protein ACW976_02755 [Candidatus Ranarchaeia archaeon]|jgi:hypothetical protein